VQNLIIIYTKISSLIILLIFFSIISLQGNAQNIEINNISTHTSFVGDTLLISGKGFDSSPANLVVQFGSTHGAIITSSASFIEVIIPAGATYDNLIVTNKLTGLSATSPLPFLLSYSGDSFKTSRIASIRNFPSVNGLYDLCMCDFNGDGKIDIATANQNANTISILTNTSTLTNTSFDIRSNTVNTETLNIKCADLNADGKPEILLSSTGSNSNYIYYLKNISTQTISFEIPAPLILNSDNARRLEVADLDLDGRPEIIVTNQATNSINFFKNESSLGIVDFKSTPFTIEVPNLNNSTGLIVKDFNGDRLPEICFSPFLAANIYIIKNTSNVGAFSFDEAQAISVHGGMVNLVSGDLNNDKKIDIVATNFSQNQISILQNTSGDSGGDLSFNLLPGIDTNTSPWGLDLGDLDGNGKPDIIVTSNLNPSLDAFFNNSGVDISFTNQKIPIDENSRNIKIGDINGDGKPDIAFTGIVSSDISTIINNNCVIPVIQNKDILTFCSGNRINLTAVNALNVTYKWYKNNRSGEILVKESKESFYNEIASPGNFEFRVEAIGEGGNCTESSRIIAVEVRPDANPASPIFQDPGLGCENESITLSLDPTRIPDGATFLWKTPSGSTKETQTPSLTIDDLSAEDAGLYEVEIKAGSCQSDAASLVLELLILSNTTISNNSSLTFCGNDHTTLSVLENPGDRYQWVYNGADINTETASTLIATSAGDYAVRITTPEGCSYTTNTVTITTYAPPVSKFNTVLQTCIATSVAFTNNSTVDDTQAITYEWDFDDGTSSMEKNPSHEFATPGIFNVSLTTSYDQNCTNTTISSIEVINTPEVTIKPVGSTTICAGEELKLTATLGFDRYLWSTGSELKEIIVDESGTYSLDVISNNNCATSTSIDVLVNDLPEIAIESIPSGYEFQLIASGGVRYEWAADPTLSALDIPNPIANPETTTTYAVTGYDDKGCMARSTITVTITERTQIPPLFTPNGDNENDLWVFRNVEDYENCTLIIFNRSGQIVFNKKNYSNDWDGTNDGKTLEQGVYYYTIECSATDTQNVTGSVTILR
jgi:gliding motility-associated-like protein